MVNNKPIKAKLSHARELHYCSSGIRLFCKIYGLDFMTLVKVGLDVDVLIATGDTLAIAMANLAIEQQREK